MSQGDVLTIFKDAVWLILELSAPMLLISIVLGLVIAIFQAATQIHEQTMTFVPKVVAIALILVIMGSWMLTKMTDFFEAIMGLMTGL